MTYDTTWRRRFDVEIFHLIDTRLPDGSLMHPKEVAMVIGISKWQVYRALRRRITVKNSRKNRQRERWTRRPAPVKI